MPLVAYGEYIPLADAVPATDGTQTVSGNLHIGPPTVIELDRSVFNKPGTYVVFRYGSLTIGASGFDTQQLALNAQLSFDASDLLYRLSPNYGVLDSVNKTISITLV